MIDVMCDVETLGNEQKAVVTTIALVQFDLATGNVGKKLHIDIDPQSCLDIGFNVTWDTIKWWMTQKDALDKVMLIPEGSRIHIGEAMQKVTDFMEDIGYKDVRPWGNGACFDLSILSAYYSHYKSREPWQFWNERDVRTLVQIHPKGDKIKKALPFEGTAHNPIDDCLHQIKYCSMIFQHLVKNL